MSPKFMDLPGNIRASIYLLSLEPRVIRAVPMLERYEIGPRRQAVNLLSNVPLPSVLAVSKESRAVTRRLYPELYVPRMDDQVWEWKSRILFNPAIDTWQETHYPVVAHHRYKSGEPAEPNYMDVKKHFAEIDVPRGYRLPAEVSRWGWETARAISQVPYPVPVLH